ncbi:MAG: hypothetical protein AB7G39_03390 [Alphaproteobacteria bacterium]
MMGASMSAAWKGIVVAVVTVAGIAAASADDIEVLAEQGLTRFAVVPKGTSPDQMERAAERVCGNLRVCMVLIWDDRKSAARQVPMTDKQVNAKVATFNRNRNTGMSRLLVSCALFPGVGRDACF